MYFKTEQQDEPQMPKICPSFSTFWLNILRISCTFVWPTRSHRTFENGNTFFSIKFVHMHTKDTLRDCISSLRGNPGFSSCLLFSLGNKNTLSEFQERSSCWLLHKSKYSKTFYQQDSCTQTRFICLEVPIGYTSWFPNLLWDWAGLTPELPKYYVRPQWESGFTSCPWCFFYFSFSPVLSQSSTEMNIQLLNMFMNIRAWPLHPSLTAMLHFSPFRKHCVGKQLC